MAEPKYNRPRRSGGTYLGEFISTGTDKRVKDLYMFKDNDGITFMSKYGNNALDYTSGKLTDGISDGRNMQNSIGEAYRRAIGKNLISPALIG